MKNRKLIIDSDPYQTRIVLLEGSTALEYFVEKNKKNNILTGIYKGIVARVLPGMNAAFINIGLDKMAFLYGGDSLGINSTQEKQGGQENISNNLTVGQEVICQIIKEPLGTKGPRVSMSPKIPGRFLVLTPNNENIGISRRIKDENLKEKLIELVQKNRVDETHGFIIRTASQEASENEIIKDIQSLADTWRKIIDHKSQKPAPSILYQDLTISEKSVRDLYDSKIDAIICNSRIDYENLKKFSRLSIPSAEDKVQLYEGKKPIFDSFGIEEMLNAALDKVSHLDSGGYLIIEETEALTTIDVNTGSYTGKANIKDTILKINCEAIPKLVEQVRLRNIGGIIIIDFIDMEDLSDREKIYNHLVDEFSSDRARTKILKVSDLGIIEMTRKRTNESLSKLLTMKCSTCNGSGRIRKIEMSALQAIRAIIKNHAQTGKLCFDLYLKTEIRVALETYLKSTVHVMIDDFGIKVNYFDLEPNCDNSNDPWVLSYPP